MNNIRLGDAVDLQDARMDAAILTVKNYVGTDNILQNKEGIKDSSYVPTTGKTAALNCKHTSLSKKDLVCDKRGR